MTTPTTPTLDAGYQIPEEERRATGARRRQETYPDLVARLSHQSVVKHFDAYADVPWDDPEYRIDPEDPRWELPPDDVLGATSWYRSQPPAVRARIGLHMIATFAKIGLQFEGVLKRGLLEFALRLPGHRDEGAPMWLPIDAKFPREDYERLLDAQDRGRVAVGVVAHQGQPPPVRLLDQ